MLSFLVLDAKSMNVAIDQIVRDWFDVPDAIEPLYFEGSELQQQLDSGNFDYVVAGEARDVKQLAVFDSGECIPALILFERVQDSKKNRYLRHNIDVSGFVKQQGNSFPASKKTLFSRAIGRKAEKVMDVTGGWLGDSLLMCSQNYTTYVLERHWLMQGFIQHACESLSDTLWAKKNSVPVPRLYKGNAIDFLNSEALNDVALIDCIYVDPMFPPKVKQSAAVRKSMKVLHELVGQDTDAEDLFVAAYSSDVRRIVVKRPGYAQPLGLNPLNVKPTETLAGKLVRYDIYIR